ncbi:hypothetical protein [Lactobacillus taiwanensis]|uniref:hypothetical protein n=1 Tax=Lactobacillus taiwanensis TaxID=508451 RepID=UPI00321FD214
MQVQEKLKENISIILERIDEIQEKRNLDIHDMADLARYTKSLKDLMVSLQIARELML